MARLDHVFTVQPQPDNSYSKSESRFQLLQPLANIETLVG